VVRLRARGNLVELGSILDRPGDRRVVRQHVGVRATRRHDPVFRFVVRLFVDGRAADFPRDPDFFCCEPNTCSQPAANFLLDPVWTV
jgi:hypothetical protein